MLKAHEWKEVELHTHVLDPLKVSRICWSLVKVNNVDTLLNDTLVDELRKKSLHSCVAGKVSKTWNQPHDHGLDDRD